MCLRCAGVGHVAVTTRCKLEARRSPKRKRMHVRSKRSSELDDQKLKVSPTLIAPPPPGPCLQIPAWSFLSLLLTSEIATVREELSLVVVVTIISKYVMDSAMDEVLPSVINHCLAGPLTPLHDNTYLIPLSSHADVKKFSKMEVAKFATKDGCAL